MKLTQEILDSGKWISDTIFKIKGIRYTKLICEQCGEFFIVRGLKGKSKFCSHECYGVNRIGKKAPDGQGEKIRASKIGKKRPPFSKEWCENIGKAHTGKKKGPMSEAQKKLISKTLTGRKLPPEQHDSQRGEKNWQFCPYHSNGIPKYDAFVDRLEPHEECKRSKRDPNILRVRCYNCGEWFIPTLNQVGNRLGSIRNNNKDYNRFYCSKDCKKKCPRYRRQSLYSSQGIPKYDLYAPQLMPYEECRRNEQDPNVLETKCAYCGKWFLPTISQVGLRIRGLCSNDTGRYYCSSYCKQECPIYKRVKYYKGQKGFNSREVQPELRQLVFLQDGYECQKCGSTKSLHCHHITGVELNPIESADIDNCITLCNTCHKEAHTDKGCRYWDLRRCTEDNKTMVVN